MICQAASASGSPCRRARTEPDVLVLDEPTRGVDPEARLKLAALLRREAAGRATLLVTHDLDLVAAVAGRTVELGERIERVAA